MADGVEANQTWFAYAPSASGDLQQGDVLKRTDGLKGILQQFHQYYATKVDYTHFLVLTQSCDLLRRQGAPCKARYITLAAVRPLSLVVAREIAKFQKNEVSVTANVCSVRVRDKVHAFVETLLNNNDPEYFYLHPDPTRGLPTASCAFLGLSVSIKTSLHYAVCAEARILSLTEIFQAKLGWLVGTMYSRVGTEDWPPGPEFSQRIDKILEESCQWVPDDKLKSVIENPPADLATMNQKALREVIRTTPVKRRRDILVATILEELAKFPEMTPENVAKFEKRLRNNPTFNAHTSHKH